METIWSAITACTILGSVYSAEELYAWLGQFVALKKLSMPKEGPNTLITPIGPHSLPLQFSFVLETFVYHAEGGPGCLSDDIHFPTTILSTIGKLEAVELAVDEENWTGAVAIFQHCNKTVADLDLKFHRWSPTKVHPSFNLTGCPKVKTLSLMFIDNAAESMIDSIKNMVRFVGGIGRPYTFPSVGQLHYSPTRIRLRKFHTNTGDAWSAADADKYDTVILPSFYRNNAHGGYPTKKNRMSDTLVTFPPMTTNLETTETTVPDIVPSSAPRPSADVFLRTRADDAIMYANTGHAAAFTFSSGSAAKAVWMGGHTCHRIWKTTTAGLKQKIDSEPAAS
ncbi:hypothetical protein ARMGADRAFT_1071126 [Armillaria gallica]|uniref:Uncharacterized protein n=1 Tax=Armillaria gallica TaxID=47427 RepID=A0A2H3ED87_ARMGA|nr:hypothetical protein ARMGADRAFT_1071126 [Armillaria gallica]